MSLHGFTVGESVEIVNEPAWAYSDGDVNFGIQGLRIGDTGTVLEPERGSGLESHNIYVAWNNDPAQALWALPSCVARYNPFPTIDTVETFLKEAP